MLDNTNLLLCKQSGGGRGGELGETRRCFVCEVRHSLPGCVPAGHCDVSIIFNFIAQIPS